MAKLINGKEVSLAVQERIRKETEALKEKGITPGLAVVIVGDDPAPRSMRCRRPPPKRSCWLW